MISCTITPPPGRARLASGSSCMAGCWTKTRAPCRMCWLKSGRPMPAGAIATARMAISRRLIPISAAAGARSPMIRAITSFTPSNPVPTRGATGSIPGVRRMCIFRSSARPFHSGSSPNAISRAIRSSRAAPSCRTLKDPAAVDQLTAALDMNATIPLDSIAYRFDIVLRGRRATYFENRPEGG